MTTGTIRTDGWANFFSGMGVRGRDTHHGDVIAPPREWTRTELNWLYRSDAIAARAIDVLPDDATRQGFRIGFDSGDPADAAKLLGGVIRYMRRISAKREIRRGLSVGRLHGGSVAVLGLADGRDLREPVNREAIQSIQWIRLLSRWFVERGPAELDPSSPHFGNPSRYTVTQLGGSPMPLEVHPDRVLVFPGAFNPEALHGDTTGLSDGWDDSGISRLDKPLARFEAGYAAAARVATDFSRATYTIKNLAQLMASGQEAAVRRRIEIAEMSMSVLNAILLDPDESFAFNTRALTGFPDILNHLGVYLSAATGMPITRLLGLSPGGFGTGDDEDRRWDDVTIAYQDENVRPIIERLVEYIFLAKDGPSSGKTPPGWEIEFNPLSTPEPKQEAEIRKLVAESMVAQVNARILFADEAAQAMHGGGRFGMDVVLDAKARADLEASAAAGRELEEREKDPDAEEDPTDVVLGGTRETDGRSDAWANPLGRMAGYRRDVLDVLTRVHDDAIEPDTAARFLNRFHGMPLDEALGLVGLEAV